MNKLIVLAVGAFAAIAMSLTLVSQAGASPDTTGETFSEASAVLTEAGYSAVVSTSVGSRLAQSDCTVTRQQDVGGGTGFQPPGMVNGSFMGDGPVAEVGAAGKPRVLLSLNCSPKK
jgi:hypothetical protein